MANVSDELLMAYVDGELDERQSIELDRALATDASLLARAQRFRATRDPVRRAFDGVLREPIPRDLIELVRNGGQTETKPASQASILTFSSRPVAHQAGMHRPRPMLRMAAGLALLVLAGAGGWALHPLVEGAGVGASVTARGDGGAWMGALQSALETAASGSRTAITKSDPAEAGVRVVSTFRSRDQRFCRQYSVELDRSNAFDGLACRSSAEGWLVEHQVRRAVQSAGQPGLRPAAGRVRQAIDATVDALIDGGVLDPTEEQRVLESRWNAPLEPR